MSFALNTLVIRHMYAVNIICYHQPVTFTRRNRSLCALAYKTAGKTVYSHRDKKFVSDKDHLLFIPRNVSYSFHCVGLGPCYMIELDCDLEEDDFRSFPVADPIGTEQLFKTISGLWTMRTPGYEAACMSCAYEILYKVYVGSLNARYTGKRAVLLPALAYLETCIADPEISNALLAEKAAISEVYFRKLFTREFGVSPMQYVRTLRIEKAKGMLLGDFSSISAVAASAGFSSVYSFCRTFKKATGLTPTEFSARSANTAGKPQLEMSKKEK